MTNFGNFTACLFRTACPISQWTEFMEHCAVCNGSHLRPAEEESIWLHDGQGHMRVFMCASGHDIIRMPQSPELDRCTKCPAGRYSLGRSRVDEASLTSPSEPSCMPCPFGSECEGKNVAPRTGYWWYADMMCPSSACHIQANGASKCDVLKCSLPDTFNSSQSRRRSEADPLHNDCQGNCTLRSVVLKCAGGACLGGLCGQDSANQSCCAAGRTGPLCAVCLPGRILIRNECQECVATSLTVSAVFLAIALAVAWYVLAWRPVFETKKFKFHPLNILEYILWKMYTLYRWTKAMVASRRNSNGTFRREGQLSFVKSLQNWYLSLFSTAKEKGVMSYTKVCIHDQTL